MKNKKRVVLSTKVPLFYGKGRAGVDLPALFNGETHILKPGEEFLFNTGVRFDENNCSNGLVVSRSGLAKQGILVKNAPGIIDWTYRGEILVILVNTSKEPYTVLQSERIAQLVLIEIPTFPVTTCEWTEEKDKATEKFVDLGVFSETQSYPAKLLGFGDSGRVNFPREEI